MSLKENEEKNIISVAGEYYIKCTAHEEVVKRTYTKAIHDCLKAIPLRSDWDDDVKVTARMVIEATREAIESYLPIENN